MRPKGLACGDGQKRALGLACGLVLACAGLLRASDGPLDHLDRASYIHNMEVRAQHFPGSLRPGKMQMMAIGERRFLFTSYFDDVTWNWAKLRGQVLDVTDPRNPVVVNDNGFRAFGIQVAYNQRLGKWLLMLVHTGPRQVPGLRGISLHDASDPTDIVLLSKWSTDGGDPERKIQTGSGTHRDYYDGGRYAYLDTAPDDSFYHPGRRHPWSRAMQILDVSDPTSPQHVANWWLPGQRVDEVEERRTWREFGDPNAYASLHGPIYVPVRVEDGGRLAFGPWGSFGVLIHDLSDIRHPRLIGRWRPEVYVPGPAFPFHTVDVSRLDRGFVIASPEAIETECNEPWHETWILDVRDPTKPMAISKLPVPTPPPQAPYTDFCHKRGRFGPHNAPHVKAPGRPHPNFTCYSFFNAGLQCYDLTDPAQPRITAYFVPPQGGSLDTPGSYERNGDSVFVEWDRKLIWLASDTGLWVLSTEALGDPVLGPLHVAEWSLPGLNEGHP